MSTKEENPSLAVAIVALLLAATGVIMAALSFGGEAPAGSVSEKELNDSLKNKLQNINADASSAGVTTFDGAVAANTFVMNESPTTVTPAADKGYLFTDVYGQLHFLTSASDVLLSNSLSQAGGTVTGQVNFQNNNPTARNYPMMLGVFSQTQTTAVQTNTVAEVTLLSAGRGTLTLAPNSTQNGQTISVNLRCFPFSLVNTNTVTISLYVNNALAMDCVYTGSGVLINGQLNIDMDLLVTASLTGTIQLITGNFLPATSSGSIVFDKTIANTFDVRAQFGSASVSNNIQCVLARINTSFSP